MKPKKPTKPKPNKHVEFHAKSTIHVRRLIHAEFHAGSKVPQATKNINDKLGASLLTETMVSTCFNSISVGDFSVFDKGSRLNELARCQPNLDLGITRAMHSTLFLDNNHPSLEMITNTDGRLATLDGRIALFLIGGLSSKVTFQVMDLFHGTKRAIELDLTSIGIDLLKPSTFLLVNFQYLLLTVAINRKIFILLCKIDSLAWTIKVMDIQPVFWCGELLLSQTDPHKFLLHTNSGFVQGQAKGDKLFMDKWINMDRGTIAQCLFRENVLFGRYTLRLGEDALPKDCIVEFNLLNGKYKFVEIPAPATTNGQSPGQLFSIVWINDNQVFCAYRSNPLSYQVYMFDFQTKKLTDLKFGFQAEFISGAFLNHQGFLVVHAKKSNPSMTSCYDYKMESSFYRFPIRRPDSLLNLCWFTALNTSRFLDSDFVPKIQLPENCELRPKV